MVGPVDETSLAVYPTVLDRLSAEHARMMRPSVVESALEGMRRGGVALVHGGILGVLQATLPRGLDTLGGLDAMVGVAAMIAAVGAGEFATEARTIGSVSLGVWAFRRTDRLMTTARETHAAERAGDTISGEDDEDPILAVARQF